MQCIALNRIKKITLTRPVSVRPVAGVCGQNATGQNATRKKRLPDKMPPKKWTAGQNSAGEQTRYHVTFILCELVLKVSSISSLFFFFTGMVNQVLHTLCLRKNVTLLFLL